MAAVAQPSLLLAPYWGWNHTGELRWIGANGRVYGEEPPQGAYTPAASELWNEWIPHYAESYIRSLASIHRTYATRPVSAAALAIASRIYGGESKSETLALPDPDRFVSVAEANRLVTGSEAGPFSQDNWRTMSVSIVRPTAATVGPDGHAAGGFSGHKGDLMNAALAVVNSVWRCTVQLNNALYGSSHTICFKGPSTREAAVKLAKKWVMLRAALLGSDSSLTYENGHPSDPRLGTPIYEWMTVSDAINPRDAAPVILEPDVGRGYAASATGNSYADTFSSAFSVRLEGLSEGNPPARSYHVETFLGFPDRALTYSRFTPDAKVRQNMTIKDALKAYLDLITSDTENFGFLGVDPNTPRKLAVETLVSATGEVRLKVPQHGYVTGDTVRVMGRGVGKLRKNWRVAAIDTDTVALVGSLANLSELPRTCTVRVTRMANGTRPLTYFRLKKPTAQAAFGGPVVKTTKRNFRAKSIPISFVQKGR